MLRIFLIAFVLNVIGPVAARADEANEGMASSRDASHTNPHRRKHHQHKKIKVDSTATKKTVAPADTKDVPKEGPDSNTDAPGMSDSLGTNNPSNPNLGASDHIPGTTGTSGQ